MDKNNGRTDSFAVVVPWLRGLEPVRTCCPRPSWMLFGSTLALPSPLPPAKIETNFLTGWVLRVMFVTVPFPLVLGKRDKLCFAGTRERERKEKTLLVLMVVW